MKLSPDEREFLILILYAVLLAASLPVMLFLACYWQLITTCYNI